MISFHRTDRTGLASNIGIALISVLVVNSFIFTLIPQEVYSNPHRPLTPPGYVIGIVWTALFVCMACARWHLLRSTAPDAVAAARLVAWLAVFCLAYPAYTLGLRSETIGLIGNFVTLIATILLVARCLRSSRAAAAWTAPIAVWLSYASFLSVLALRSR